ncbi:NAD-binding protein [Candidatus Lokiarchaeum ossiferum]
MYKDTCRTEKMNFGDKLNRSIFTSGFDNKMPPNKHFITFKLKIKQIKVPLLICFLFFLMGLIYFAITESSTDINTLLLLIFGIIDPQTPSMFSQIYTMLWTIVISQVIIALILSSLMEKYNPITTCQIYAQIQKDHTVIISYNHLGERIYQNLKFAGEAYSIIDQNTENVDELVNSGEPVVIGDPTEKNNLIQTGILNCKKAIILSNDTRETITIAYRIRKLNPDCEIFARVFEKKLAQFLQRAPVKATIFSTSDWTIQDIDRWSKSIYGTALVIGNNHMGQKIAELIGNRPKRQVIMVDHFKDEKYPNRKEQSQISTLNTADCTLEYLENSVELRKVTQCFICWNNEEKFTRSLILLTNLVQNYGFIKVYVRIFDKELFSLVKELGGIPFSTSLNAANHLKILMEKKHTKSAFLRINSSEIRYS